MKRPLRSWGVDRPSRKGFIEAEKEKKRRYATQGK